jgi:hypothetical protein
VVLVDWFWLVLIGFDWLVLIGWLVGWLISLVLFALLLFALLLFALLLFALLLLHCYCCIVIVALLLFALLLFALHCCRSEGVCYTNQFGGSKNVINNGNLHALWDAAIGRCPLSHQVIKLVSGRRQTGVGDNCATNIEVE